MYGQISRVLLFLEVIAHVHIIQNTQDQQHMKLRIFIYHCSMESLGLGIHTAKVAWLDCILGESPAEKTADHNHEWS